jgi:protein tyrosine/serine phosphatase
MHERVYITTVLAVLAALAVTMKAGRYLWRESAAIDPASRPANWAAPLALDGVENFHRVSDVLYRGEQPTDLGMKQLRDLGIRTIVNLRLLHSDREEIGTTGVEYEHLTVSTWHPEDKEVIRFLQIVADPSKMPVFVHCHHGSDRTGTMCAVYRIAVQGWSKSDAIAEMTQGGFGFHSTWQNLVEYLEKLDIEAIKAAAGIAN